MLHAYKGIKPQLHETVFTVDSAEIIGDVIIEEQASLWFNVTVRGDANYIRIGKRTNVQDGTTIHVYHDNGPTLIGDDVTIGHNVVIHGCTIGNRCLIGMGAIVLDKVVIEDDAIIGAGAVVTPGTVVKSGSLYVGSPARFKRELTQAEIAGLKQSSMNYIAYTEGYEK